MKVGGANANMKSGLHFLCQNKGLHKVLQGTGLNANWQGPGPLALAEDQIAVDWRQTVRMGCGLGLLMVSPVVS